MGVPAFFRWLMLKYPKVIVEVLEEKATTIDGVTIPVDATKPNPNNIEFDNLYLDMNGIVHNCSHGEDLPVKPETEEEMMELIFKYIDRLVNVARPRKLIYMAIDGCAPRAKMNQQRSRRFKAAMEREENEQMENDLRRELLGTGMKVPAKKKKSWDHNVITPGTPFMTKLAKHLRYYIRERQTNCDHWRDIRVVLSDGSVPGEGEHKIMDFIRRQRTIEGYDPNMKHILHGLDADLIMLGLATHEADFTIFREQVFAKRGNEETKVADNALFDKPLQFLRIPILREYLKAEFSGLGSRLREAGIQYDFERVVDDFVFLCFFVGNDFLPHLPSLDIREGGIAILLNIYKRLLPAIGSYLTHNGKLNLGNIDIFLAAVAETEEIVFQRRMAKEALAENSKKHQAREPCRMFMQGKCKRGKACRFMHVLKDDLSAVGQQQQQQELCRNYQRGQCHRGTSCHYRHVDLKATHGTEDTNRQAAEILRAQMSNKNSSESTKEEELTSEQFDQKLKETLFEKSIVEGVRDHVKFGQAGWKTRYYESKFGERARKDLNRLQRDMAQSYVEGLQWVLLYYYDGCPSWSWFYPFHYAPCASDLINVDQIKIDFELSKPFRPVDQLMGVQPSAGAHMLPKACRKLMMERDSPIIDFYPKHFKQDPNGKTAKWLWVVLLPFIDEARLRKAVQGVEHEFSEEEKKRNQFGHDLMFFHFNSAEATMLVSKGLGNRPRDEENDDTFLNVDRMNSTFSVSGTFRRTKDFLPRSSTVSSPSSRFSTFTKNMCLAVRFEDPVKKPHICRHLPGSIEPAAVLELAAIGRIKEPKMGRGMRFDDLGSVAVTPAMLREETNRAHSIVSNAKGSHLHRNAPSFRPPAYGKMTYGGGYVAQSFQAPGKWGSNIAHPEPSRKRMRRDYPRPSYPPRPSYNQGYPPRNVTYNQAYHPRPAYNQGYLPPRPAYNQGYRPPRPAYNQGYRPPRPAYGQQYASYPTSYSQNYHPRAHTNQQQLQYSARPTYSQQYVQPRGGGNTTVPSFETLQAMLSETMQHGGGNNN